MKLIIFITLLVSIMLLSAGILLTVNRRKILIEQRMSDYFKSAGQKAEKDQPKEQQADKKKGLLSIFWEQGVTKMSSRVSSGEQKKLHLLLRDAGLSAKFTPIEFRLLQLSVSLGGGFLIFLLMAPIGQSISMVWMLAGAVAFLGFRYPMFYLAKKRTLRIKEINKQMPDFFDMVNLLLEAGVGLDSAISNVCQKKKGPLSEEFQQALEDMKLGKSRREAFYELRKRVPSDMFQSVIMAIIQADQLGIGMAKVLKNLTIRIREQRREAAREQAMKAPIKMLFPMVFFIFPAIFIVILGPLVITILTGGLFN